MHVYPAFLFTLFLYSNCMLHTFIPPVIPSTAAFVICVAMVLKLKASSHLFYLVQIYPGAVELMQVIEEFIHIVGLGMKDFHNSYLTTGNLGKIQHTFPPSPPPLNLFYHLFLLDMDT